jgi:hypothetical protein
MLRKSALIVGIVLILIGVGGVGAYAAGVVDIVVNDLADRSWLFWGFGFLGFGLVSLGTGVGLLILWRGLGRREQGPPQDRPG